MLTWRVFAVTVTYVTRFWKTDQDVTLIVQSFYENLGVYLKQIANKLS